MSVRQANAARLSLLSSAAALVLWLVLQPQTADLAAQVYRTTLFERAGWIDWDNNWFGGHHLLGYSLISPWLMSLAGVAASGAVAAVTTTAAFAAIARSVAPQRWLWPSAWVAWASVGDLLIGRVTYSLGLAFALLAALALVRRAPVLVSGLLAALSAASSPVAGLFLLLALAVWWTVDRRRDTLLAAAAGGAVAFGVALLFGDGGAQPYSLAAAGLAAAIALVLRHGVDASAPLARRALLAYAAIAFACWVLPTPMGSNVARLGVAFALPVALLAPRRGSVLPLAAAGLAATGWLAFAPATEIAKSIDAPETHARYYAPLLGELAAREQRPGRVEVVPSATRWESVYVGAKVPLARGWETQLDRARNPLFYARRLTAGAYLAWLRHNAVSYVALSDAPKERWGRTEEALLRRGAPGLTVAWRSRDWTLYAVTRPAPLATGATLRTLLADRIVLDVPRPGPVDVRVRWSPYWTAGSAACVLRRRDGFLGLQVRRPGRIEVRARAMAAIARPNLC